MISSHKKPARAAGRIIDSQFLKKEIREFAMTVLIGMDTPVMEQVEQIVAVLCRIHLFQPVGIVIDN